MGKLRFLFALWMAKLSIPALKITHHNGTDFPGSLALKLCPDFLRYVGKPKTIIAVTGTNGKTTVSNLLSDLLTDAGRRVMTNRSGSNIVSGISTAFIRNCTLFGKVKRCDVAVLEVDERCSPKVYPYVKPDFVVLTNLFRDSIMRNAHPFYIADILTAAIPETATVITNADDLIACGVAPRCRHKYFAIGRLDSDVQNCVNLIDDLRICPHCAGKLRYEYRRYHHIGRAICENCGFASPQPDYAANGMTFPGSEMPVTESGVTYTYPILSDSFVNAYNVLTAVAALRELGYSHETIRSLMSRAKITASRHSFERVGDVTLVRQMAKEKNALATSRAFDYIAHRPGRKEVLMMMNCLGDTKHWSENTCWIFDSDFEFLRDDSIVQIVCTGSRCLDYKLRLLLAGVPEERIVVESDEFKAAEALHYTAGDDVYLLSGTDSLALSYRIYDRMKALALAKKEAAQ